MIKGVMIINNHGKPRITKFYEHLSNDKQQAMIREMYSLISKRSERVCNFLEEVGVWGKDTKLVYRVYATLYFVVIVDGSESELGILDLIHVFVEALDHIFENVCELDLIFHSDKVHYILDEIIMGGMVLETNLQDVLLGIREQEVLEAGDSKVAQARLKIAEKLK
jgi:AP-3 complex subunit sigma